MANVNSYIQNYKPKDYATSEYVNVLADCSFGVNPSKFPDNLENYIKEISTQTIKTYPYNEEIIDLLIARYTSIAKLSENNICLGNGQWIYSQVLTYFI